MKLGVGRAAGESMEDLATGKTCSEKLCRGGSEVRL
jgi:hypothetical protein